MASLSSGLWATAASVGVLGLFYVVARRIQEANLPKNASLELKTKRRAWLLTALNSLVTSCASVYFASLYLAGGIESLKHDGNHVGQATTAFFAAYLMLDLGIGFIDYRELIDPFSGWGHHTVYLALLAYLNYYTATGPFCLFLICELPTLILSIGHIAPSYRQDALFGISFFLTRILLHIMLIAMFHRGQVIAWPFTILALYLHATWFRKWLISQGKRLSEKNGWQRSMGKAFNIVDSVSERTFIFLLIIPVIFDIAVVAGFPALV